MSGNAIAALKRMSRSDLEDRFMKKFNALKRVWKGTTGQKETAPGTAEFTAGKRANRAPGVRD